MSRPRAWTSSALALAATAITPACALIDGLGGGDQVCEAPFEQDCSGSTCAQPFELGTAPLVRSIDSCEATSNAFELGQCGIVPDRAARTAVFRVRINVPGDYEICGATTPERSNLLIGSVCDHQPPGAMCVPEDGGCTVATLDGPDAYVFFQESSQGSCPIVDIEIQFVDDVTAEADCLDGRDDDDDGFTDCEDRGCQDAGSCNTNLAPPELCNRRDDGAPPPFADASIDELACRCVDDDGCDDLATGGLESYVCHPASAAGFGVCGPPCDRGVNWCSFFETTCVSGRCVKDGGDEICLNNADDDADGEQDCEELACRPTPECGQSGVGTEACDGLDDQVASRVLPPGLVDELACSCLDDAGCDGFDGGPAGKYLCQPSATGDGIGYCAPSCETFDWCTELFGPGGAVCDPDGRCFRGASISPQPAQLE